MGVNNRCNWKVVAAAAVSAHVKFRNFLLIAKRTLPIRLVSQLDTGTRVISVFYFEVSAMDYFLRQIYHIIIENRDPSRHHGGVPFRGGTQWQERLNFPTRMVTEKAKIQRADFLEKSTWCLLFCEAQL